MNSGITVVIPTIPPRVGLLERALRSVESQSLRPDAIIVEPDPGHTGAAATRQRGLERVSTPWVTFLDDDDEMLPGHLASLYRHAEETDADMVYSWFHTSPPGMDPFPPHHFTNPFDPADPIETTIVSLVKTELALRVGFAPHEQANAAWPGEDRRFTLGILEAGGNIQHLVERTWIWHHDSGNTSGLGSRW